MPIIPVFDRFDQIIAETKSDLELLCERQAKKARDMMARQAPRSDVNTPGYSHFADEFEADQIGPMFWTVVNHKIVNGYALWKLLEYGTRYMSPRKTVFPVMGIVGPEFIREAGRGRR
jgi:hypothetical protein